MDDAQLEKGPLTQAEKLEMLAIFGVELDEALAMRSYVRANERADRITSEPENSALIGAMATARAYLSPLEGDHRHYWPAFIVVARHSVKVHGSDYRQIEYELYDFVGGMLMKMHEGAYPNCPDSD